MVRPSSFNVNNELRLPTANDLVNSFRTGTQLADEMRQAQSKRQVGNALASGDYETATKVALQNGDTETLRTIQGLQDHHQKEVATRLGYLANTAYDLLQKPMAERTAAFEQKKNSLRAMGLDDATLNGVSLTDDALQGYVSNFIDLKDKIAMGKGVTLGADDRLVNPYTKEVMVGANPKLQFQSVTAPNGSVMPYAVDARTNQAVPLGGGMPGQPAAPANASGLPAADQTGTSVPPAPPPARSTADITPAMSTVASTLSSKLRPAVVAGFMGNFHIEGGYTGAQGDGGSASGIAQWRNERAANFQRVMGKPVQQASHEEQAQFVLWELENPQAAGMTVAQRDAILNARTPAEAATLIDRFYERSSGRDRMGRVRAANAFSGLPAQSAPATASAPAAASTGGVFNGTPADFLAQNQSNIRMFGKLNPDASGWYDNKGQPHIIDKGTNPAEGSPLSGSALDVQTERGLLDPKSVTVGGMGGAKAKLQMANHEPEVLARYNLTTNDIPVIQGQFQADKKAYAARTLQVSQYKQAYTATKVHAEQLKQVLRKMPAQTSFTPFNAVSNTVQHAFSGEAVTQFDAMFPQYAAEVARVMSGTPNGGGQLTDSARHEMDTLRGNASPAAKMKAMDKLDEMMLGKIHGPEKDMARLKARMDGGLAAYARDLGKGGGNSAPKGQRRIVRSGIQKSTGRKVVQYSDGTTEVQ